MRTHGLKSLLPLCLGVWAPLLAACPSDDDDDSTPVPILDPEPAGAPEDVADGLDNEGRTTLGCLGNNAPEDPVGESLTLPGWVRTLEDATNEQCAQPSAEAEAYNESGAAVGAASSDTENGRVAIGVAIQDFGFIGSVVVTAEGYIEQRFASSRPVTNTDVAGWTWLVTQDEVDAMSTAAGVELDAAKGIVVGAVHDCSVFGVANAVVTLDGSADGVVYLTGAHDQTPSRTDCPTTGEPKGLRDFGLAADATFTQEGGRFVIPNVAPGTVTVEAWARSEAGGPLELMSHIEVQVDAGKITAVDLEPRVGATE